MDPLTGNNDSNSAAESLQTLEEVAADLAQQSTCDVPGGHGSTKPIPNATSPPERGQNLAGEAKVLSKSNSISSKCEVMTFYNHSTHPLDSYARWSEFQDPVAEEARLKELGKTFAIIHRQSKVEKGDVVTWITASIQAQSPRLRTVLDVVFSDYPSWYPDESPYAVAPPFKPYVLRWESFLEIGRQPELDENTANELQLLRRELEPQIGKHLSALDRIRKAGVISFDNLWLILNPSCLMISSKPGGDTRVFKLVQIHYIPESKKEPARYKLTMAYVEWNGERCGVDAECEIIADYEGFVSVAKLPVFPVEFDPRWKETERRLLARGRKFESLRGYHFKTCHGKKYTLQMHPIRGCLMEVEKPVSGRITVDAYAYYRVQGKVPPELIPLVNFREGLSRLRMPSSGQKPPNTGDHRTMRRQARRGVDVFGINDSSSSSSDSESEVSDSDLLGLDSKAKARVGFGVCHGIQPEKAHEDGERKEDMSPLTDLECVITSPRVKGFDLAAKEWCEFNVDDLEDNEWNSSCYDNLVLPEGERDLVFAFANRPRLSEQGFDDFVAHKGEGIIILLCGPPGVGKTLTAEAVAEKSRVPLYIVSASDLGIVAAKVEKGLMDALECCQLWGAVLLIDEADVFLESRDSNNLEHNEIVSIFLRRLEYYRGLMFLTTNRSKVIDNAFKSRIDLILPYSDLHEPARRKIWVNFIQKLHPGVVSISDSDFDQLQKIPMNGREIKNAIKTALILADTDRPLRLKHLQLILDIRKRVERMEREAEDSTS